MKNFLAIMTVITLLAVNGALGYKFYTKVTDRQTHAKAQNASSEGEPNDAANPANSTGQGEAIPTPSPEVSKGETAEGAKSVVVPAALAEAPKPTAKASTVKETTVTIYDETYKYIGETSNGKANGQGTAYYKNGQKRYEGEFQNGTPSFVGKSYYEDGTLRSVGKRTNGMIQSTRYNEDGSVYAEVSNKENSKAGTAKIYYPGGQLLYSGQVLAENSRPEGQGTEYHPSGNKRYTGTFKNALYSGSGLYVTDDQRDSYEGQFINGEMSGKGKFYGDGSMYYEGDNQQGIYNGKGKFYMNGMIAYDGDFVDGTMSGQGKMYDNGKLVYEGEFQDNIPTGNGTYAGSSNVKISITIRNSVSRGSSGGTFNMPSGVRVPSYGEVQESLAKKQNGK